MHQATLAASKRKRQYPTRKKACFVKIKPHATLRFSTSHRDINLWVPQQLEGQAITPIWQKKV